MQALFGNLIKSIDINQFISDEITPIAAESWSTKEIQSQKCHRLIKNANRHWLNHKIV